METFLTGPKGEIASIYPSISTIVYRTYLKYSHTHSVQLALRIYIKDQAQPTIRYAWI